MVDSSTGNNPFVVTGYKGKKHFCNRDTETDNLISAIYAQRPVVLYAPRKFGKSGLIHHVFAHKQLKDFDTLYIDLFETESMEGLLRAFSREVLRTFEKKQERMIRKFMEWFAAARPQVTLDPQSGMPELTINLKDSTEGYKPLHDLFHYLENREKPVVLALDEFQQISTYGGHGLEAEFRKIVQTLHKTRLIISGSTQHLLVPMFTSPSRPLYQTVDFVHLGYLERSEYLEFIHGHFRAKQIDVQHSVIEFVLEWSRRHTYYTQLICNKLFALGKPIVTLEDVHAVTASLFSEREMIFQQLRNTLPRHQFKLLQAIGKAGYVEQYTGASFINQYALGAHSTVRKSMEVLLRDEYVLEEFKEGKSSYRVYDVIMGRWLEKTYAQNH